MAEQTILLLLDELPSRFQGLDVTHEASQSTLNLSHELYRAAREAGLGAADLNGRLEGCMLALARALLAWSPQAAEALPALLATPGVRLPQLAQFGGGCYSLMALASLAGQLRMQPAAAFRIAATCQLVFDVGRLTTAAIAASVEADAAAGRQADANTLSLLATLTTLQLGAVMACSKLVHEEAHGSVVAAFARSTARPAVLVPWLAAMSRAVLALRGWREEGQDCSGSSLVDSYSSLTALLTNNTYEPHAAAIAADPAVQDAILEALLTSCLPRLAARFGEAVAAGLPPGPHKHLKALCFLLYAVRWLPLEPAIARHMQAPGAAATVRQATNVLAAAASLPVDLPVDVANQLSAASSSQTDMQLDAVQLFTACCRGLNQQPVAAGGRETSSIPQQGSEGGGGSGAVADAADQQLAVAWELVAAVPHVCSVVRELLASAVLDGLVFLGVLTNMIKWYGRCLSWVAAQATETPCSAEQLSAWAAAGEATHRLIPVLAQHDGMQQQQHQHQHQHQPQHQQQRPPPQQPAGDQWQLAGSVLVSKLASTFYDNCPLLATSVPGGSALEQRGTPALRRQLLQAHLAGCRLVHWLAQQASVNRALLLPDDHAAAPAALLLLLNSLCQTLLRRFQLEVSASGWAAGAFSADLQAACAAHVEAAAVLTGLAAAASSAVSGSEGPVLVVEVMSGVSGSLIAALTVVPSLAAPAALAPVEALLPAMLQADTAAMVAATFVALAHNFTLSGPWAAALAGSSLLAAGLDAVAKLLSSSQATDAELAGLILERADAVLAALDAAAVAAVEGAADSGLPDSLASQLEQAAGSLREQWGAGPSGLPATVPLPEKAELLRQLLQPAADLAALMQQYYALPAVAAERQLAVAQVAAGRCCAYLRCAHLEGEGGPAAGEGVGSKRCSACRAVRYCGTACSHADWREGGHRRVCKALGAARRAAKEAAAAAAAAAAQQH